MRGIIPQRRVSSNACPPKAHTKRDPTTSLPGTGSEPQEDRIPAWILNDEECFFAFMAGYVDAEGSIKVDRRGFARFNLHSYDRGILSQAQARLVEAGVICPPLRLDVPAGRCNKYGITSRKNLWGFSVNRKLSLDTLFDHLDPHLKHRKRRQDMHHAWDTVKRRMGNEG
jgi:hypothetical protein